MLHRKNTVNAAPDRRWKQLAGKVFRRKDLADELPSVDRELGLAVKAGTVRKAAQGLVLRPPKNAVWRCTAKRGSARRKVSR
jgi:hypothetical protein